MQSEPERAARRGRSSEALWPLRRIAVSGWRQRVLANASLCKALGDLAPPNLGRGSSTDGARLGRTPPWVRPRRPSILADILIGCQRQQAAARGPSALN